MPHRKVSGDCFHACKGRVGSLIGTVHLFPAVMVRRSIHHAAQCSAEGRVLCATQPSEWHFFLHLPTNTQNALPFFLLESAGECLPLLALAGGIGFLSHHWMKITETSLKMFPSGSPVQLISKTILQLPGGRGEGDCLVEPRGHSLKKGLHSDPKKRHTRLSVPPDKAFVNAFRVYYRRLALVHYEYQWSSHHHSPHHKGTFI